MGFNQSLIVFAGEHTEVLRQCGWTKRDTKRFLIEHARRRVADFKRAGRLAGEITPAEESTWRYLFENPDDLLVVWAREIMRVLPEGGDIAVTAKLGDEAPMRTQRPMHAGDHQFGLEHPVQRGIGKHRVELGNEVERVAVEPAAGRWRLAVENDGPAIPAEALPRLFDSMVSLREEGAGRGEHLGLGLAIVRRAVQRMNGSVGVRPAPEGGSVFWIELPAADAAG